MPKGNLDGPRQSFAIAPTTRSSPPSPMPALVIAYKNGSPVRLGDIASVIDSVENQSSRLVQRQIRRSFSDVRRQPGAISSPPSTNPRVAAALKASLPPAIKVDILTDRTETNSRLDPRGAVHSWSPPSGWSSSSLPLSGQFWATVIPALPAGVARGHLRRHVSSPASARQFVADALTIAAGSSSTTAIVMIENIVRHIGSWRGTDGRRGQRRPSKSASTSSRLPSRWSPSFIPLLSWAGSSPLFREFAITLSVASHRLGLSSR